MIGMWKAFEEMEALGWVGSQRPRMVAVQSEGCAPIVKAYEEGSESAEPWLDPATFASGIRVPKALGDFLILDAVRASEGCAVAVPESEIYHALGEIGHADGLFYCPEGAACLGAFRRLRDSGWIQEQERVVLFNTGAGTKYVDSIKRVAAGY